MDPLTLDQTFTEIQPHLELDPLKFVPVLCSNCHPEAYSEVTKCLDYCDKLNQKFYGEVIIYIAENRQANTLFLSHILTKNISPNELWRGLIRAVKHNNLVATRLLLDAKAPTYLPDYQISIFGHLHQNSSDEMFDLLIEFKVDINLLHVNYPILSFFIRKKLTHFSLRLIALGAKIQPQQLAEVLCHDPDPRLLEIFIPIGRNARIKHYSMLEYACVRKCSIAILAMLDDTTNATNLLFHLLENPGDTEVRPVIRALIARGAGIDGVGKSEHTSMHHERRKNLIKALRESGYTPLYSACKNNLTRSAIELIRLGAKYSICIQRLKLCPAIEKALSLNFPQHPQHYAFSLDDFWMLNFKARNCISTLMLCRMSVEMLQALPIELLQIIFSQL